MNLPIVLTDPAAPGGDAGQVLRPVPLASQGRTEAWLRDFLIAHPSVLPSGAIDPAYADAIPVCRELRTRAGPLDCLFVTRFGGLIIVECKLWRNPQARREVVGQILDYAKEVSGWTYSDLQREVSIARKERGTNSLFDLVSAKYPATDEAAFVDAVTANLARGRLMLLVAGDGIREGTESIVQYLGRHAGLHFTFGLVEMAGYAMPDGRLLVQPRILARTVNVERAVVRIEGAGAGLAEVLNPDEAPLPNLADEAADERGEAGPKRSFDPVILDADRRWRVEFASRVRFDDPAQSTGQVGYGRVWLDLPVPWAWMSAYSSRRNNECGNTLVLKGVAGREVFDALQVERDDIEAELVASTPGVRVRWKAGPDLSSLFASRTFAGRWAIDQEAAELDWLLDATNAFVNAVRPRVLQLLGGSAVG